MSEAGICGAAGSGSAVRLARSYYRPPPPAPPGAARKFDYICFQAEY
jgi:hypothetical protein